MEIPEIKIRELDIPQWSFNDPSHSLPYVPPVTVNIGVPIVDIPGCVEAHEVDENNMLESDDPKGVKTYCDGQAPPACACRI